VADRNEEQGAQDQEQDQEQQDQQEELESPEFIDNRIDVKAATVVTLEYVIRSLSEKNKDGASGKQTKFNLLTNFGIVEGTIATGRPSADKSERKQFVTEVFLRAMDIRNDQLQKAVDEFEGEPTVVNNTGAILVEDVTITPFANPEHKIEMDHVYLFTDQIAGVTANI
jgi:hypothetical protein